LNPELVSERPHEQSVSGKESKCDVNGGQVKLRETANADDLLLGNGYENVENDPKQNVHPQTSENGHGCVNDRPVNSRQH
jgi:hypothetical protein